MPASDRNCGPPLTRCNYLMIAQAGIDRSLKPMKLLRHILLQQRADADVDDVATNQNQVGMLPHLSYPPSGQTRPCGCDNQMQIGNHDQFERFGQRLSGGEHKWLAHLVLVVEIAVGEKS